MAVNSTLGRYNRIISKFRKLRILVVGDIMLDEYIWGDATRISPEAPVPVVEVKSRTYNPGGAANTALNILSLGASATMVGVTGRDECGKILRGLLLETGMDTSQIAVDPTRPTTCKTRIVAHSQQVIRADVEDASPVPARVTSAMAKSIDALMDKIDGIAVSDYNKGALTPDFMRHLTNVAKEAGKIITADIKPTHCEWFKGATVITPNKLEAQGITGIRITDEKSLRAAGLKLREMMGARAVLITLGAGGMAMFNGDNEMDHIPALSSQVFDVTGAGDTVLATLTLCLSAGSSLADAMRIANYAAGIVVRKMGTATATDEELKRFITGGC